MFLMISNNNSFGQNTKVVGVTLKTQTSFQINTKTPNFKKMAFMKIKQRVQRHRFVDKRQYGQLYAVWVAYHTGC